MTNDATDALEPGQGVVVLASLGAIWMAWSSEGLVRLEQRERPESAALRDACTRAGMTQREVPAIFRSPLEAFDAGAPIDLATLPVVLRGPPFHVTVWTALRRIPRGHVRTYGGLAHDAGSPRATRAVGTAMAKNPLPLVVPCHRVVAHGHLLGGYSDGLPRKRVLLEREGVRIEGDRVLPGQLDLL